MLITVITVIAYRAPNKIRYTCDGTATEYNTHSQLNNTLETQSLEFYAAWTSHDTETLALHNASYTYVTGQQHAVRSGLGFLLQQHGAHINGLCTRKAQQP